MKEAGEKLEDLVTDFKKQIENLNNEINNLNKKIEADKKNEQVLLEKIKSLENEIELMTEQHNYEKELIKIETKKNKDSHVENVKPFCFSSALNEFSEEKDQILVKNNQPSKTLIVNSNINATVKKCPNFDICKGLGNRKKNLINHRTLTSCPKRYFIIKHHISETKKLKDNPCMKDEQFNIITKKYECLNQKYLRICNKIMFFNQKRRKDSILIKKYVLLYNN